MDTGYIARLAVIFTLVVGSIYILLPTFLQDDAQARFAADAAALEGPEAGLVVPVTFEGDRDAAQEELTRRLDNARINYVAILPGEEGVFQVTLAAGVSEEAVAEALAAPPDVTFYDLSDLVEADEAEETGAAPEAIASYLAETGVPWFRVEGLAGQRVPPATQSVASGIERLEPSGDRLSAVTQAPRSFMMVALDNRFVGVAWPEGEGRVAVLPFDTTAPRLMALATVGELTAQPAEAAQAAEADAPTRRVPPWLAGILPDTVMSLGLDLQGGIDLTLQVDLEEAILSQASRDAAHLREQVAREGLDVTSVREDRVRPRINVTSNESLGDLQRWFLRNMPHYDYSETSGANTHVFSMASERRTEVQEQAIEQVLETLRSRVDATGVREPSITQRGDGAINIQLPGVDNLQQAIDAIGTTAMLEFRMVDGRFDQSELQRMVRAAEDSLPEQDFLDDRFLNDWLWDQGRLPESHRILWEYEETAEGKRRAYPYPLFDEIILTGNDVSSAGVAFNQQNMPFVSLEFKPQGARVFCRVTTDNVRERFAIILDGEVQSAPSIRERICGGRASIEMGQALDALRDAETLALVLRTGSLNAPVSVGQVRQVGASLGADSIRAGSIATMVGGIIVLLFMGTWFRTAGMLANLALIINVLMVLAILSLFGATLTLPGIAGIALTVGMAVDANIIIYERIREELELGQSARKAVDTGFDKGLVAVVDANITTAIAGVVLFSYGTGPIRGFAVTLLIGIVTTLTTALFVNRTFMELATRSSTARLRI